MKDLITLLKLYSCVSLSQIYGLLGAFDKLLRTSQRKEGKTNHL